MLLNIYNKLECAQSKFPALRRFRFRICSRHLQAQFGTSVMFKKVANVSTAEMCNCANSAFKKNNEAPAPRLGRVLLISTVRFFSAPTRKALR
jgi:hypothetical protein